MPFDFVADVTCDLRLRASSNAKRRMRSTPRRVKMVCCMAISSSVPSKMRPPTFEYSPSTFSRTTQKSIAPGFAFFSGDSTPFSMRTGRRFAYCSKLRRIGISSPQSEMWSGTPG